MTQSDRSDARAARVGAWKLRAAAVLAAAVGDDASAVERYTDLAATVVGMFDAGARDAEVATFLKGDAVPFPGLRSLTDPRIDALAAELHRAATGPGPHVAT
jgi:hypothetical protein